MTRYCCKFLLVPSIYWTTIWLFTAQFYRKSGVRHCIFYSLWEGNRGCFKLQYFRRGFLDRFLWRVKQISGMHLLLRKIITFPDKSFRFLFAVELTQTFSYLRLCHCNHLFTSILKILIRLHPIFLVFSGLNPEILIIKTQYCVEKQRFLTLFQLTPFFLAFRRIRRRKTLQIYSLSPSVLEFLKICSQNSG